MQDFFHQQYPLPAGTFEDGAPFAKVGYFSVHWMGILVFFWWGGIPYTLKRKNTRKTGTSKKSTLRETNIGPEDRPFHKERSIPIIHFRGELLNFGGVRYNSNNSKFKYVFTAFCVKISGINSSFFCSLGPKSLPTKPRRHESTQMFFCRPWTLDLSTNC